MTLNIPTERQVLRCIYDTYAPSFPTKASTAGTVMIETDIEALAAKLKCDKHMLFGYLYYYLDHKYAYPTGENSSVKLFAVKAGELKHAVNLPYLAAILATADQEHSKFAWSLGVSLVALALSVGAIIAQLITAS